MHPSEITILFVDDSRLVRAAAKKILSNTYHLIEAVDGKAAWETLNSTQTIDLVISDLSMPNLGGLELVKCIRQSEDEGIQSLPIIIASGADKGDGNRQTVLAAGANAFIRKPFNGKTLNDSIQSLIQVNQQTESVNIQSKPPRALKAFSEDEFLRQGEALIAQANRHHREVSLLKIEIDKYKVLFLRQGKAFIDHLAKQILELLMTSKGTQHIVARTGLAEFSVLLPDADPISARHMADSYKCALEKQAFSINDSNTQITVSAGLSCPVLRYDTQFKQLITDANEKLAIAYGCGGNVIITDSANPLNPQKSKRTNHTPTNASSTARRAPSPLDQLAHLGKELIRNDVDADRLLDKLLPLLHYWSREKSGLCQLQIQQLEKTLQKQTDKPKTEHATHPA
ncbi:MAG: response regulator [Gammaproteobacteria bacterium]